MLAIDQKYTANDLNAKISYKIRHVTWGRVRISLPALLRRKNLMDALKIHLSSFPGVLSVKAGYWAASMTVRYDASQMQREELLNQVAQLTLQDLRQMPRETASRRKDHEVSLRYLKIASGTVGLSLLLGGFPLLAFGVVYPLVALIALPIYARAYRCIRNEHRLNCDFLDACAITVGLMTGDVINASLMSMLVHMGDYIRDLTAARSRRTIHQLLDFQENDAWVLCDGVEVQTKVRDIQEGDVVVLNTGDLIPVDGQLIKGELIVDQQVLTGESMPVHKEVGDDAFASTVIIDGSAQLKAVRTGDATKVAQVVRLVEEAPLYETKIQNHAELFADRLVVPSLLMTGALFAVSRNTTQLAGLLGIDAGTGVRVAAPTAVLSSMITSAADGILIKGGGFLEKLSWTDTIIFDKTGTLTTGVIHVEDLISFNGYGESEMLSYAATAEMQMTHPIAAAVVRHAENLDIPLKGRSSVKYVVGRGVRAEIHGKKTLVGSLRLMRENGIDVGSRVLETKDKMVLDGKACLYVAIDNQFTGMVSFRDQVRKESRQMIDALHRVGVKQVVMLTGDVEQVARPVAESLGIDRCVAEMLPEQKAEVVKEIKEQGHTVAFVGDGINDSVALSYADIGFSVKGGADIAKESAGVILLNENLMNIPRAFEISRETMGLIKESYWIVGGFNAMAYALAAVGLATPVLTTLISNGSSVIACLNGMKPIMRMKLSKSRKRVDMATAPRLGKTPSLQMKPRLKSETHTPSENQIPHHAKRFEQHQAAINA